MTQALVRLARLLAKSLIGLSALTLVGLVWMAYGWPIGIDRWLFRLAYRSFDFFICARELAALGVYWWRGEV
jgi:hypothetical protein